MFPAMMAKEKYLHQANSYQKILKDNDYCYPCILIKPLLIPPFFQLDLNRALFLPLDYHRKNSLDNQHQPDKLYPLPIDRCRYLRNKFDQKNIQNH